VADDASQRTEKPTPKRLREARRRGQIPRSPDLVGWFALLVASFVLPVLFRALHRVMVDYFARFGQGVQAGEWSAMIRESGSIFSQVGLVLLPFLALVVVLTAGGLAAQGGVTPTAQVLRPKFERISPKAGLKRLVSTQSAVETVKAVVRLAFLALLLANVSSGFVASYINGASRDLASASAELGASLLLVVRLAAFVGVAIGVADYGFQRRKVGKQLKMTRHELKQEQRSTEGDPMVKSRRRSMHARLSRNQILAAVNDASVVIVNPMHVAVALSYVPGGVPTVVAKGTGTLAARIRERAFQAKVPVVEAPPLARLLNETIAIGAEVPAQLYEAVAIVIAFVMRLPAPPFERLVRRVNVPRSKLAEPVVEEPDPSRRRGRRPGRTQVWR
jgi:flagellar biosynthetic protein FlhB